MQDQGAVEVVCGAASASGDEQRPAAACLANLCSDPHLLSHFAANPATINALTALSSRMCRSAITLHNEAVLLLRTFQTPFSQPQLAPSIALSTTACCFGFFSLAALAV